MVSYLRIIGSKLYLLVVYKLLGMLLREALLFERVERVDLILATARLDIFAQVHVMRSVGCRARVGVRLVGTSGDILEVEYFLVHELSVLAFC